MRRWFADVDEQLTTVDLDGEQRVVLTRDVDELLATRPKDVVRLLPAFDQFVLGPGTSEPAVVPPQHRARVSRTASWIAPVIVTVDGVVGTWEAADRTVAFDLFEDAPAPDPEALATQVARIEALLTAESTDET